MSDTSVQLTEEPQIDTDALPCPFCGCAAEAEILHGGPPTKFMIRCSSIYCKVRPSREREAADALSHLNAPRPDADLQTAIAEPTDSVLKAQRDQIRAEFGVQTRRNALLEAAVMVEGFRDYTGFGSGRDLDALARKYVRGNENAKSCIALALRGAAALSAQQVGAERAKGEGKLILQAQHHLEDLLKSLAAEHYPENMGFRPLTGDLIGMLTQIDNMMAGLVRFAPSAGVQRTVVAGAFLQELATGLQDGSIKGPIGHDPSSYDRMQAEHEAEVAGSTLATPSAVHDASDAAVQAEWSGREARNEVRAATPGDFRPELEKLRALSEAATPGEWRWRTSNSWLRLGTKAHDGYIAYPYVSRGNGHPDLCIRNNADRELIVTAVNYVRASLAEELKAGVASERSRREIDAEQDKITIAALQKQIAATCQAFEHATALAAVVAEHAARNSAPSEGQTLTPGDVRLGLPSEETLAGVLWATDIDRPRPKSWAEMNALRGEAGHFAVDILAPYRARAAAILTHLAESLDAWVKADIETLIRSAGTALATAIDAIQTPDARETWRDKVMQRIGNRIGRGGDHDP